MKAKMDLQFPTIENNYSLKILVEKKENTAKMVQIVLRYINI